MKKLLLGLLLVILLTACGTPTPKIVVTVTTLVAPTPNPIVEYSFEFESIKSEVTALLNFEMPPSTMATYLRSLRYRLADLVAPTAGYEVFRSEYLLYLDELIASMEPAPNAIPDAPPVQSFDDVPPDHWAYEEIELLHALGVTVGCSYDPPLYCPDRFMTRSEAAVFVARLIEIIENK